MGDRRMSARDSRMGCSTPHWRLLMRRVARGPLRRFAAVCRFACERGRASLGGSAAHRTRGAIPRLIAAAPWARAKRKVTARPAVVGPSEHCILVAAGF